MSNTVTTTIADGIALIRIDNPPVNALSPAVIAEFAAAVDEAEANAAVHALVVICAGRTFIAGADIKGLEQFAWGDDSAAPDMHDLLRRIEDCSKPVVMAIHGSALGGGLEVAIAGHYRVAVANAQMGQPEVNLGIIPGAEGTQRLPRLVGVEKAIDMCVSGTPVKAPEALQIGLIDQIIDGDLETGAVAFARESTRRDGPHPKTRHRRGKLPAPESLDTLLARGRAAARKTRPHLEAPLAAVDAIEAAVTLQFEEGCRREREIFLRCARSEQCKALIHAFFAERSVSRVPGITRDTQAAPIGKVVIVGAGTTGNDIAVACSNAGIPAVLTDTDQAVIETRSDAVKGCILVISTSTVSIETIAKAANRPHVIGLHLAGTANAMRLVEIVRGAATSAEAVAAAMAFAKRLGKVGVVVGNCPGLVGDRMTFLYVYEAQLLIEEGATPEQVDRALTSWGMAAGVDLSVKGVGEEAGTPRRTFTDEDIIERTIYAIVNEGARVLDEGFALRASDIDVIYMHGYGFPAFRGGPMFYADRVGLPRLYDRIATFHRERGDRWKPAPLLERLATTGSTFKAFDALRS